MNKLSKPIVKCTLNEIFECWKVGSKSVYEYVVYDPDTEANFVLPFESNASVKANTKEILRNACIDEIVSV